jgi:NAD(P)-dependent dehydrogenase (short-subunit alcohol dehydrogenase family)
MSPPGALVTGVSVGIGRAIARRLAADGYEVHGTYLTHELEANELAAELPALALHRVDLAAGDGVQKLLDVLPEGRLHALVNNAGIALEEPLDRFEPEIWERTFAINLMAPVALTRALEGRLADGAVVNLASTDARVGSYSSAAYAASKAALVGATRSLANLLARSRIRVNSVSPRMDRHADDDPPRARRRGGADAADRAPGGGGRRRRLAARPAVELRDRLRAGAQTRSGHVSRPALRFSRRDSADWSARDASGSPTHAECFLGTNDKEG